MSSDEADCSSEDSVSTKTTSTGKSVQNDCRLDCDGRRVVDVQAFLEELLSQLQDVQVTNAEDITREVDRLKFTLSVWLENKISSLTSRVYQLERLNCLLSARFGAHPSASEGNPTACPPSQVYQIAFDNSDDQTADCSSNFGSSEDQTSRTARNLSESYEDMWKFYQQLHAEALVERAQFEADVRCVITERDLLHERSLEVHRQLVKVIKDKLELLTSVVNPCENGLKSALLSEEGLPYNKENPGYNAARFCKDPADNGSKRIKELLARKFADLMNAIVTVNNTLRLAIMGSKEAGSIYFPGEELHVPDDTAPTIVENLLGKDLLEVDWASMDSVTLEAVVHDVMERFNDTANRILDVLQDDTTSTSTPISSPRKTPLDFAEPDCPDDVSLEELKRLYRIEVIAKRVLWEDLRQLRIWQEKFRKLRHRYIALSYEHERICQEVKDLRSNAIGRDCLNEQRALLNEEQQALLLECEDIKVAPAGPTALTSTAVHLSLDLLSSNHNLLSNQQLQRQKYETDLERLQDELKSLEAKLIETEDRLATSKAKFEEDLGMAGAKNVKLESDLKTARETIQDMLTDHEALELEQSEWQEQKDALLRERGMALANVAEQLSRCQLELSSSQQTIEMLTKANKEIEQEKAQLMVKLTTMHGQSSALKMAVEDIRVKLVDVETWRDKAISLESELLQTRTTNEEIQHEKLELRDDCRTKNEALLGANRKIVQLQDALAFREKEWLAREKTLEFEIKSLREKVEKNGKFEETLSEKNAELEAKDEKLANLKDQLLELHNMIELQDERLKAVIPVERAYEHQRITIAQLKEEVSRYQAKYNDFEKRVVETKMDNLIAQHQDLEAVFDATLKEKAELSAEVHKLRSLVKDKEDALSALRSEFDIWKDKAQSEYSRCYKEYTKTVEMSSKVDSAEVDSLRVQNQELLKANEALHSSVDKHVKMSEQQRIQLVKSLSELRQLQFLLRRKEDQCRGFEEECRSQKARAEELHAQSLTTINELRQSFEEERAHSRDLLEQNASLTTDLEAAKFNIAEIQALAELNLHTVGMQAQQMKGENEALRTRSQLLELILNVSKDSQRFNGTVLENMELSGLNGHQKRHLIESCNIDDAANYFLCIVRNLEAGLKLRQMKCETLIHQKEYLQFEVLRHTNSMRRCLELLQTMGYALQFEPPAPSGRSRFRAIAFAIIACRRFAFFHRQNRTLRQSSF